MKRFVILFTCLVGLASIQSAARACDYQQSFAAPACYVQPAVQIQSYAVQPVVQYQQRFAVQQYAAPVQVQKFAAVQSYGYAQQVQVQKFARVQAVNAYPVASVQVQAVGKQRVGLFGGRGRSSVRVRVR